MKQLIDEFEEDPDPLNLLPEVKLLRALIVDFAERYDEQTEALVAWHASFGPGFDERYGAWNEKMLEWRGDWNAFGEALAAYRTEVEAVQTFYRQGWPAPPALPKMPLPPRPPAPEEAQVKPRQVTDILEVGKFIGQVGALVDRIHRQRETASVSLLQLREVLKQFGFEMYQGLVETVADESVRTAVLEAIERRWSTVVLPTGSSNGRGSGGDG